MDATLHFDAGEIQKERRVGHVELRRDWESRLKLRLRLRGAATWRTATFSSQLSFSRIPASFALSGMLTSVSYLSLEHVGFSVVLAKLRASSASGLGT